MYIGLYVMYIGLYVKYPLFFSVFNESWIFWADFRKTLKYQISLTSVPQERSCSMREGGSTDRRGTTKLKSLFAILRTRL